MGGGRPKSPAYASPPRHPPMAQAPSRAGSMFRDAASVAGGVAVGTTVGHVAGEAISGLFGGGRRREVERVLPQNYDYNQEPTGPCAYEISQFLNCAAHNENLQECQAFNQALLECKKRNHIP